MPIPFLDAVEFSKIPSLGFVIPVVSADPTAYEAGFIYNSTERAIKFHNGTAWKTVLVLGDSAPPNGSAGGDLAGSTYPNPVIANGVITDAKVAAANKDGLTTTPSMRTLGSGAQQAAPGNDPRLTDSRPPNGAAGGDLTGTFPSPQIAAGVIVDADVSASANIAQSKISGLTAALIAKADNARTLTAGNGLVGGGDLSANRDFAVGAGTGISVAADSVALDLPYTDSRYLTKSGGVMTGPLVLAGAPQTDDEAASKAYVDLASQGFTFKSAVRVVAVTNVTQSGTQTIDGIAVAAGNRVLCANQTTPSQNGIWVVAAGAWTRAVDMDATGELVDGTVVPVAQGTLGGDSQYLCVTTAADPWVPGTTGSTWTRQSGLADLQAGAGLTKTGNQIDVVAADASLTVNADSIAVASAPKLTTGRTIALTGDVTGTSVAFDGQANLSFATAIGAGVVVDADVSGSAAIAQSKIANLVTDLGAKVPTTRQVIAGNGLTGGGALSADATLNVVGDANLSVAADLVSVLSAPKWQTARTLSLTGDVTGSVAMDGSANVSLATTLATANVKRYTANIGNGSLTSIPVAHNLGTRDVHVAVYNAATYAEVQCGKVRTDTNTVTLTFATAPASNSHRVVVLA